MNGWSKYVGIGISGIAFLGYAVTVFLFVLGMYHLGGAVFTSLDLHTGLGKMFGVSFAIVYLIDSLY